ncbi:MAG: TIGR00266 family protein [Lachnospiraceae bacterium]|nr:TIGR00266 family protein [Lachnospiraceae bacterium]
MRYEIKGGTLPVVEVYLDAGESINCEGGAMTWMSDNLEMTTEGGGMGKMFSKMLSNEKMFSNTYTAKGGEGFIAFASSFPGAIMAVEIGPGKEIICQKSAYLASTPGVELSIQFQKNVGAGFFGGEGFIMQKISGQGIAFLEIDGSVVEHMLAPGQRIIIDTGYLAMMDGTCTMSVESVKGIKNKLLGGEGFFNTVVTGPGKVALQSMPASAVASVVAPYIASK